MCLESKRLILLKGDLVGEVSLGYRQNGLRPIVAFVSYQIAASPGSAGLAFYYLMGMLDLLRYLSPPYMCMQNCDVLWAP